MNYIFHILVMIFIYGILTLSLNLLVGYGGLLSLSQAAFYGIGAYASTLLIIKGVNFFPSLIFSIFLTSILSFFIAYPSLRLKGDYFVLATLGFQIIVFSILYNWVNLTKGPYGIPGIPGPKIFNFELSTPFHYFIFSGIFFLIVFLFFKKLYNSPYGRVLKSIREDEIAASSLGKDIPLIKIWAFAISCGVCAISGSLYATYVTYIDPTSFTLDESIFITSIVILGGSGNLKGPLIGVAFMIILPEFLRFLGLPDTIAPNVRQIIYGLLLIILMKYRPSGIMGEYNLQ